ncbi:MAG: OmpA family protein [Gammaproteobacteria bacterium]|nr:MAG: OmpA family protein [Gammaproteobacteria bacterium]
MISRLLLILVGMLALPAAAIQRYQASIEQSQWEVSASRIRCELSHAIPHYGKGSFVRSAGGELAFMMTISTEPPIKDAVASIKSVPPFWKSGTEKDLGQLNLARGKTPFYVTRDMALRLLYELEAGFMPTLQYKDWADQSDEVMVALSSANFYEALPRFQQCINQLVPYGLADLKDAMVYFDTGKHNLDREAKRQLDDLALFAQDEKGLKFFIEGHTDSRGTRQYNQRLSELRTAAVENYLISKGVSRRQISRKAYGERHPIQKNTNDQGRANNRRVSVSVIRD